MDMPLCYTAGRQKCMRVFDGEHKQVHAQRTYFVLCFVVMMQVGIVPKVAYELDSFQEQT